MAGQRAGGCVCGAVRFVATGEPLRVTICHCTWCQRRTGTAFGTEVVYQAGQVALTGGEIARPSWIRADRLKLRHVFLRSRREWSDITPAVEMYERHFRP